MPQSGHTWQRTFKALPQEAHAVRQWAAERLARRDAVQVAHELFVAVLGSRPDVIDMTLSTAGPRARITATGPIPLPARHSHGPGYRIVHSLSESCGMTTDGHGLWAQLPEEPS